jgi:hypothetical protein
MANRPKSLPRDVEGDFSQFTDFMRKLVAVPHSKIKARLDAEKETKRTSKPSASRVPDASR